MKPKCHSLKLAVLGGLAMLAAVAARAVEFHVATAQDLQNALTSAAGNGAANNIWLTNGYYSGNFAYNSSSSNNLSIQPEPGVASTNVTLDGGGGGRDLNITYNSSWGNVTVSNITFVRNCGNYQIGALRIAASSGGEVIVDGCRFLSLTNSSGMGVELASGLTAIIRNCIILGKTNGGAYDGDGINISGVTGSSLIYNCTMAGNYAGNGANITSSAVLTVTNNVIQSNWYHGLYFYPGGSQTAAVVVSNNVFNGQNNGGYYGAEINTFGTLNLGANIFTGNRGGGGAYVANGHTAVLAGNTFNGNGYYNGYYGGVGYQNVNVVIVTGNTFSGNAGGYGGGAVYIYNSMTNLVAGNTFAGNSDESGGGGGAVYIQSGAFSTVSNNTFSGNSQYGPGGAFSSSSSATGVVIVTDNTFTGNASTTATYWGGAVAVSGGTNIITGNTFRQNAAVNGGGAIYATGSAITISDNLVANNTQTGSGASGGGIFVNASATLYMINNTLFGNSSVGNGGGASFQVSGSVETLYVFNNIIWGNSVTGGGNGTDVYLTGSGLSKLFMYNDASGMYGVWNNATPQLNADPKFFDPVNGDFHLQTNSPCASYGTNGPFLSRTDLDGNSRTNSAGEVDLGCYQFTTNVFHPADTNRAWTISPAEYNAYAAAWKAGQSWTNGPNPISADYVTRAGYLMTNGGAYHNDGSARPVNWKIGH